MYENIFCDLMFYLYVILFSLLFVLEQILGTFCEKFQTLYFADTLVIEPRSYNTNYSQNYEPH